MKYLVCMDDTDMPGTKGTGQLAQKMCRTMGQNGWGAFSPITRHQLFVHEDVPYTSHNSAMCFKACLENCDERDFLRFMADFLENRSQTGSDPGLCVARLVPGLNRPALTAFGLKAKKAVLTQKDAYDVAAETGVHLSEHGGTGQGVVGALAGIGLRLSGNDGRYRGWYHLGQPNDVVKVEELIRYPFIDALVTPSGRMLTSGMQVGVGAERTKTVRQGGRQVVVVTRVTDGSLPGGAEYRTLTKEEAKRY